MVQPRSFGLFLAFFSPRPFFRVVKNDPGESKRRKDPGNEIGHGRLSSACIVIVSSYVTRSQVNYLKFT